MYKYYYLSRFLPMRDADGGGGGGGDPEEKDKDSETETEDKKDPEEKDKDPEKKKEKTYTEAEFNNEVDRIVKQKFGKWQKQQEKAVAEAKTEAEKFAQMNADEKAAYEKDKLEKELEDLKAEKSMFEMAKVARGMLQEKEIAIGDEMLLRIITTDAESTKESVNEFIKLFKGEVEKSVKEALKGKTPKKGETLGKPEPKTYVDKVGAKIDDYYDNAE